LNALIKSLTQVIDKINKDKRFSNLIQFDRVEFIAEEEVLRAFFKTVEHLAPFEFLKVKRELEESCNVKIKISLDQSCHADTLFQDEKILEQYLKDYLILSEPTVMPFIQPAKIVLNDRTLEILCASKMAEGIISTMKLNILAEHFLNDIYGVNGKVRIGVAEDAQSGYKVSADVQKAICPRNNPQKPAVRPVPVRDEAPPPWEAPPEEAEPNMPPADASVALKPKSTAPKGAVTKVCELKADTRVTIEGEVVYTEDKELKNGELIKHKFVLSDYTSSITCFFLEGNKFKTRLTPPKKGQWVVVTGLCADDSFEHEKTVKAQKIEKSNHKDREDKAESKRVELHVHTQMSAQDGVSDVKKIVARAAKWGHKAIAITDHGVVQAFPKASGIHLIYGVEGYMIDDSKRIYDSDMPKGFYDEYVVFDIETTGLSHINCDITEIGAVRVINGELTDRFQTFVKPSGPIPPRIVSLTGINDDMVKDAPLPEAALAEFRRFCGDNAVLVAAHNSDFDTKFIFHKSGEFGITYKNTVVDSLALCRLAFPSLKNHKLNTVAAHLHIPLEHHRAVNDAVCTAKIMLECFREFEKQGAQDMQGVNQMFSGHATGKNAKTYHIILLCKNKQGLKNRIEKSVQACFFCPPRLFLP